MPGILQFWQDNDIMSEKGNGHNGLDIIKVGTFKKDKCSISFSIAQTVLNN